MTIDLDHKSDEVCDIQNGWYFNRRGDKVLVQDKHESRNWVSRGDKEYTIYLTHAVAAEAVDAAAVDVAAVDAAAVDAVVVDAAAVVAAEVSAAVAAEDEVLVSVVVAVEDEVVVDPYGKLGYNYIFVLTPSGRVRHCNRNINMFDIVEVCNE